MGLRYVRLALLVALILTPAWAVAADDALGTAYAAILRGDFKSGRATVERVLESGADQPEARRTRDWLESYHQVVASRNELKAKTFAWSVEQAQKAIDADKTYLALSFAARAVPYAADREEFARQSWVADLTERCKAAAKELAQEDRWAKALRYYMLLEAIHSEDEPIRKLREEAVKHARIQLIYKDEEALKEHIKGVDRDLFGETIKAINESYYERPDFKKTAEGALDNLLILSGTTRLHEFLHGLANPDRREPFVRGINELRAELTDVPSYSAKDLQRLFNRVSDLNKKSVEIPEGLLVVEFVEGITSELDDYTSVIWPADAADFDKVMFSRFQGVGIQLGIDERANRLKVVTPLENSPALEAGIQPDDLIIAVNGEDTKGWDTDDAVRNITGRAGTNVDLTMFRPSTGETITFTLTRREIVLTTVRGVRRAPGDADRWDYMLDKEAGVAYVRLTGFQGDSERELARALEQARAEGMKGLVLDIRHNPGGLLNAAVAAVSNFIAEGEVVSTRGRGESESRERVAGPGTYKDIPMVVLVNEYSASGSEILAGALQDHGRAGVLGERTFGKGMVQHVRPLRKGARLKLTTALYHLPNGRKPHKVPDAEHWGIDPDWEVKLTPKEFGRVIEREREANIIHNEDTDRTVKPLSEEEREKLLAALRADDEADEDGPPLLSEADIELLDSDPCEAPNTDPQLETALLLIRVKLAANVPWPLELVAAQRKN